LTAEECSITIPDDDNANEIYYGLFNTRRMMQQYVLNAYYSR